MSGALGLGDAMGGFEGTSVPSMWVGWTLCRCLTQASPDEQNDGLASFIYYICDGVSLKRLRTLP